MTQPQHRPIQHPPNQPLPIQHRQPYLHDLLAAVQAPAMALVGADGQIGVEPGAVTGIYLADRRVISTALISVTGAELRPILGESDGAGATVSQSVLGGLGNPGADPTVLLRRRLEVDGTQAVETIELSSAARATVHANVTLRLASDLAELAQVKAGQRLDPLPSHDLPAGTRWTGPDGSRVEASASPAPDRNQAGELSWQLTLATGQSHRIEVRYRLLDDPAPQVVLPAAGSVLPPIEVSATDLRLAPLVNRSLADLAALELADPQAEADHFLAAGVPWYLTLFGRDSLIAARMLLPLGTELAAGTLRALARRQGGQVELEAAEEPGKILHELRRAEAAHGAASHANREMRLPPTYYGTVDATPLWILLLHEAWKWGLADSEVRALLPQLERALAWCADYGMDGSGFLRYTDRSGHGLANQGWKDSHDAVQFADGTLADGPVALAEVQAYGYAAAHAGAELLDAFGRPGGSGWRDWAEQLAGRFRDRFWISDPAGDYPALALDGSGRPVDALASNLGHLLGTGLLTGTESALVARRLGSPALSSGFGLRTLADSMAGFNPLSYHLGSVWTHDTAIAITGLSIAAAEGVAGAGGAAGVLIEGLLAAAPSFDYRLPELYSGARRVPGRRPVPYPASCRPQAWAAASAVAILTALLGPRPDAPAGTLTFRPLQPAPIGELTVRGLRFGGRTLTAELAGTSVRTS